MGGRGQLVGFPAFLGVMAIVAGSIGGCSGGASAANPTAKQNVPGTSAAPDAAGIVWVCRPGMKANPCEIDMTTAVVNPDGSTTSQPAAPAADPSIDCFYIYPQISQQTKTMNAELVIEPTIVGAARSQAGRFASVCRIFAPLYPQLTTSALAQPEVVTPAQAGLAYDGVANAFRDYLDNYSNGRGFLLIGHSEGAGVLAALLAKTIDGDAALRSRLVSAYLMGGNVAVPDGKDVGGDFANVPICSAKTKTGCIVAFEGFGTQPSSGSLFGRLSTRFNPFMELKTTPDLRIACVNPANLDGGSGALEPIALTEVADFIGMPKPTGKLPAWLSYPNQYSAHCAKATDDAGAVNWLQVDVTASAGDARQPVAQLTNPSLGLHDVEVNLTLGTLVSLAKEQAAAYGH